MRRIPIPERVPVLANEVTVDDIGLFINGEMFPYYIDGASVKIEASSNSLTIVYVPILVQGPVSVRGPGS